MCLRFRGCGFLGLLCLLVGLFVLLFRFWSSCSCSFSSSSSFCILLLFFFSSLVFGFEPSSLFFFRASGHLLFLQTFKHPDIDRGHHQHQQQHTDTEIAAHAVETHTTHPFCVFMACFSFSSFSTSVGGFLFSSHFRFLII